MKFLHHFYHPSFQPGQNPGFYRPNRLSEVPSQRFQHHRVTHSRQASHPQAADSQDPFQLRVRRLDPRSPAVLLPELLRLLRPVLVLH